MTLGEVLAQLNALRVKAARAEIADLEHIHPRNSVLDVIVVASDLEEAEQAAAVVEQLAVNHPCRAIVVLDQPGTGKSRIDASVRSLRHPTLGGAVCTHEQVFLKVQGPAADHIPSLLDALLLPDVVTYVWWTGSPPLGDARLRSALEVADVLLVDSARFERPFDSLLAMADLLAAVETVFADFHWARLQPWREVLAQFFNPPDRRGFLAGIDAVGIDYASVGRGNRSAAALLAGWLGSALGWELKRAAAGKGGVVAAHLLSPAGHPIEVAMRPVTMEGFAPGEICGVRIDAVHQGNTCLIHAIRDDEDNGHVVVEGELRGSSFPRLVLPMPSKADSHLLSRLLVESRGERGYRPALRLGAEILRSTRR